MRVGRPTHEPQACSVGALKRDFLSFTQSSGERLRGDVNRAQPPCGRDQTQAPAAPRAPGSLLRGQDEATGAGFTPPPEPARKPDETPGNSGFPASTTRRQHRARIRGKETGEAGPPPRRLTAPPPAPPPRAAGGTGGRRRTEHRSETVRAEASPGKTPREAAPRPSHAGN